MKVTCEFCDRPAKYWKHVSLSVAPNFMCKKHRTKGYTRLTRKGKFSSTIQKLAHHVKVGKRAIVQLNSYEFLLEEALVTLLSAKTMAVGTVEKEVDETIRVIAVALKKS